MNFSALKDLLFVRSNFGMKPGLERMRTALALLGDPHLAAPVLHVAGSNGKGSTCAFAEASLRAAGYKTGLYTSPHLLHFCERFRIDGEPISEATAGELLEEILGKIPWALAGGPKGNDDGDGLTFFELATLLGFLAFERAQVSAMVIEVGLGGRLDATNVVAPVACAIAPLALEHTQHLGNTLAEIAFEKAGIIKTGVPIASAGQPLEAARVLEKIAGERTAVLLRPGRDYRFESRDSQPFCYARNSGWTVRLEEISPSIDAPAIDRDEQSGLSLRGHHQRGNAALACALLEQASLRGLAIKPEHAAHGLTHARWPGRLQRVASSPTVLLDGAHNPHGAHALVRTLRAQDANAKFQLVFGALADKDLDQLLAALLPIAAAVHVCAPHTPRALEPELICARVAAQAPLLSCIAYASPNDALSAARHAANPHGQVLGCGSLYLVAELLAAVAETPLQAMPSEQLHRAR